MPNAPIILLAFANPRQDLKLSEEQKALEQLLKPLEKEGFFQLIVEANASLEDIFFHFTHHQTRDRIVVLHYAGHAAYERIFLHSETVNSEPLHRFLARQASLQLVFLNACTTQGQAQYLNQQGVPHVIATSTTIGDQAAIDFAKRFYQNLLELFSIKDSFDNTTDFFASKGNTTNTGRHSLALPPNQAKLAWQLHTNHAPQAARWTLASVADDPFFGLPALPVHQYKLPRPPFVSLRHYSRHYAAVFFGRAHAISELYKKLTSNQHNSSLVLLYGQSGVGKSSMLDAGLCPRLAVAHEVLYLRRNHQLGLLGTLGNAFTGQGGTLTLAKLYNEWQQLQVKVRKPVVVILDQLEEVFTKPQTQGGGEELRQLLEALRFLFDQPDFEGKVVLGFRKEYLAEIETALQNKGIIHYQKQFLEVLTGEAIKEIVTGLAQNPRTQLEYNLSIAPTLEETIASDLQNSQEGAVAPVLQIILSRMWQVAQSNGATHFDKATYKEAHTQGLGQFLEQQLQALEPEFETVLATGLALDLLAHHTTDLGTAQTHAYDQVLKDYAHQRIEVGALLSKLEQLRLLNVVVDQSSGLSHDTLAPVVKEAFKNSDKAGQRAKRILDNKVGDFVKNEANLLDKADLQTVLAGKNGMCDWHPQEQALVQASTQYWQRQGYFRQAIASVFVGLVLGIVGFGVYSVKLSRDNRVQEKRIAHKQAEIAHKRQQLERKTKELAQEQAKTKQAIAQLERSKKEALAQGNLAKAQTLAAKIAQLKNKAQSLAAIANRNLKNNLEFALQKSMEAYGLAQNFTIANALANSFYAWLEQPNVYPQFINNYPLCLAQWRQANLTTKDQWQLQAHQGQTRIVQRQNGLPHPQFSTIGLEYEAGKMHLSAGQRYLVHYAESAPFIVDLKSQAEALLSPQPLDVALVDFSPNAQRLAVLGANQRHVYWVEVGQLLGKAPSYVQLLEDFPFRITAMCWLTNTELLLASGKNLYIYNPFTKSQKRLLQSGFGQQRSSIQQIVVSPSGNYLLLANALNQQIQVWDKQGHLVIEQSPKYLKKQPFKLEGIAFSKDEQAIYFPAHAPQAKAVVVLLPQGIYQVLGKSKIFEKLLNN